ncbi:hypothetical protein FGADI_2336 [Fusarium gaditjirri]|uniref:Secreted protein n=1 Tax=Fusarium gaditjirri TaxID=282569 RepID=A0A8H4TIJ7_9HYPO|nr:hypothetical protein FGADI_2336 [Fusarium gaditjirri]
MRLLSLVFFLQSIWLCAAAPVNPQPSLTLTTNANEPWTWPGVICGLCDWFKPLVKGHSDKCVCPNDAEKSEQSDFGKPDQINGSESNGANEDGKPDAKPDGQSNDTKQHKESLEWQDIKCYAPHEFGKHKDIYRISQQNYAGFACPQTESKMIKKGDNSTFISYQRWIYGAPYLYNVYWKDGCELESGKTEQDVTDPLGEGRTPESRLCQETLTNAYRGCKNGGTGGALQAGCLVYEFQARDSGD